MAPPEALCAWECECEFDEEYCDCGDIDPTCECDSEVVENCDDYEVRKANSGFRELRSLRSEGLPMEIRLGLRYMKAKAGSGASAGGNSKSKSTAKTGSGKGPEDSEVDDEDRPEPINITREYKVWYAFGTVWFGVTAMFEFFNIFQGNQLCAVTPERNISGCLAVTWYFYGWLVR